MPKPAKADARIAAEGAGKPRASETQRRTRIQEEKEEQILEAALDVFSRNGFRGSTIDQIAEAANMSKPNLLYYFRTKEMIHRELIDRLLSTWLAPLHAIDRDGDPLHEIRAYIRRKLGTIRASRASSPTRSCRARRAFETNSRISRSWSTRRRRSYAAGAGRAESRNAIRTT